MTRFMTLVILSLALCQMAWAAPANQQNQAITTNYFNAIKNNPLPLMMFLQQMPKGGDLHIHLWGAAYPENIIAAAKGTDFCVNPKNFQVTKNPACDNNLLLSNIHKNQSLYGQMIESWSMLGIPPGRPSSLTHFFNIFFEQAQLIPHVRGQILGDVVNRAGREHESYLELLITTDNSQAVAIGKEVKWNGNFAKMRQAMLGEGVSGVVNNIASKITKDENIMHQQLHCGGATAQPGCAVKVRYQYLALRNDSPREVFSQLLVGFELAKQDPRVVAVNLVQAEDKYVSMQDYDLQMNMIKYLHGAYPGVHISLHAGELNPTSVAPQGLRHHIRDAINIAGAQRIGHGVDIAYEKNAQQLLNEMAQKHILVETNLTSNADILGISGPEQPLALYLQNQVPAALSTDDEGILRTDLTREFQRAILTYHLSYPTVKNLVRNSISYSFLPGKSLWQNNASTQFVAACQQDNLQEKHLSASCQKFLDGSEKARLQWHVEQQFAQFEAIIASQHVTT